MLDGQVIHQVRTSGLHVDRLADDASDKLPLRIQTNADAPQSPRGFISPCEQVAISSRMALCLRVARVMVGLRGPTSATNRSIASIARS